MRLSVGDRLGRYEIKAPVGKGGMGEVYRARDTELDRDVAVKVLPEAAAGEEDRLRRFKREAKAVARLSHPSVLEIFDFGHEGDITFAVTELLDGKSLREHLDSNDGTLPWAEVREIAGAVADGLAVMGSTDHNLTTRHRRRSVAKVGMEGWVEAGHWPLADGVRNDARRASVTAVDHRDFVMSGPFVAPWRWGDAPRVICAPKLLRCAAQRCRKGE